VGSSLHTASNGSYNPYLPSNNHKVPDLTHPRSPPRDLRTPIRNGTRSRIRESEDEDNKENTNGNANGWNFGNAFTKIIGSVGTTIWNTVKGTPLKKSSARNGRNRQSQSQPPRSPPTNPRTMPSNPYLPGSNVDSLSNTIIPEDRPTTAPSRVNTTVAGSEPNTPPQQTRPLLSNYLSSHGNDDNHSVNTAGTDKTEGKAVIAIHSLLQRAKLSPDDAAWLHSKIDQVTHDRHDGSLSYIGNVRGAARDAVRQSLDFDDSATEHSYRTVRGNNAVSPLRTNLSATSRRETIGSTMNGSGVGLLNHSAMETRRNGRDRMSLPTSMPPSRYTPQPPSFHIQRNNNHSNRNSYAPSDSVYANTNTNGHSNNLNTSYATNNNHNALNKSAVISLGNGNGNGNGSGHGMMTRNRRKRGRMEVFHDEDVAMEQTQQRKKIKLQRPHSVRKRNYLRPMHSYQTSKYQLRRPSTPQGKQSQSQMSRKATLSKSNTISMATMSKEVIHEDKIESPTSTEQKEPQLISKEMKPAPTEDTKPKVKATGFAFVSQDDTVSMATTEEPQVIVDKKSSFGSLGSPPKSGMNFGSSPDAENNAENKPLKRTRRTTRSPLKDGKNGINSHRGVNTKSNGTTTDNEDDKDKLKNDDDDDLMKEKELQNVIESATTPGFAVDAVTATETPKSPTQGQEENANDANDGVSENTKKEDDTKQSKASEPKPVMSYFQKVLKIRRQRYLDRYKERLRRIYAKHNADKLKGTFLDDLVAKYNVNLDKLHSLYTKVCRKYGIKPHPEYDGQEANAPMDDEGNFLPINHTEEDEAEVGTADATESKNDAQDQSSGTGAGFKFGGVDTTNTNSNSLANGSWNDTSTTKPNETFNANVFASSATTDNAESKKDDTNNTNGTTSNGFGTATFSWNNGNDSNKVEEKKTDAPLFGVASTVSGGKQEEKKTDNTAPSWNVSAFSGNGEKSKQSNSIWGSTTDTDSKTKPTSDPPASTAATPWKFGSSKTETETKVDGKKDKNDSTNSMNGGWNFAQNQDSAKNGNTNKSDNNSAGGFAWGKKPDTNGTGSGFGKDSAKSPFAPKKVESAEEKKWSFASSSSTTNPWGGGNTSSDKKDDTANGTSFAWSNGNGNDNTAKNTTSTTATPFSWGNNNGNDDKKDDTKTNTGMTWPPSSSKPSLDKSSTAPAASTSGSQAFQFSLPSSTESKSNGNTSTFGSGSANGFGFGGAKPALTPSKTVPSQNAWGSSNGTSTATNGGGIWGNAQPKDTKTDASNGGSIFSWDNNGNANAITKKDTGGGGIGSSNWAAESGTNNNMNASQFGTTPSKTDSPFASNTNNNNSMFGSNNNNNNGSAFGNNNGSSFSGFGSAGGNNNNGSSGGFVFNTPLKGGLNSNNENNGGGGWGSSIKSMDSSNNNNNNSNNGGFSFQGGSSGNGGNQNGSGLNANDFFQPKKRPIFKAKRRRR